MIKKIIKYGLIGLVIAIIVVGAIVGYVAATFDPNAYKPKIIQLVKEKKQRTLKLEGEIKLSFFPNIAADLGKVWLSEHENEKEFASVDHASVSLKLLPLLKKQLVINEVAIKGVRATLIRYKDGRTNIDDLMSKEEKSEQFAIDIDHIAIEDATLFYRDEGSGARYEMNNAALKTGRIANGVSGDVELAFKMKGNQPKHDLGIKFTSRLTPDLDRKTYLLENIDSQVTGAFADFQKLDAKLKGDIDLRSETREVALSKLKLSLYAQRLGSDVNVQIDAPKLALNQEKIAADKLTLIAKLKDKQGTLALDLRVPDLNGSAKGFKSSLVQLQMDMTREANQFKATMNGVLEGGMDNNMRLEHVQFSALTLQLDGKFGDRVFNAALKGNTEINLLKQSASGRLTGKLLDSAVDARFGAIGFAAPRFTFSADIDQLDMDRLLPAKAKENKQPTATDQNLDFSFLKKLNIAGNLRIGKLKFSNVKAADVKIDIKAGGGRLDISPLSANLYQGSMRGSVAVNAVAAPTLSVKQSLNNINVGGLIRDFANKDVLDGKGNVSLDVASEGTTVMAIKRALAGTMTMRLTDGAIKGINIAASLRAMKAKMGMLKGEQTQSANKAEKTDFSEMNASFNIKNGVAHNQDLAVKSPLLRIGGDGDIDIGSDTINYDTKVTVVATTKGQGGADLESLNGVTIPLRIVGPLTAPSYKIDFGAMFSGVAKQKLETKKEEVKNKVEDKLKGKLKGLFK